MKQEIFKFSALLFLVSFSIGTAKAQSVDEQAVKECALDYLEGWYSADTARMAQALSKDLAKKGFLVHPNTGELHISPASYDQMLQWVGQKPDQLAQDPDIKMEVHVIEVGARIAMVKTVTPDFIDYLHMAKVDGQWKIYHAVWERPPAE
jgi:hypothetical protein